MIKPIVNKLEQASFLLHTINGTKLHPYDYRFKEALSEESDKTLEGDLKRVIEIIRKEWGKEDPYATDKEIEETIQKLLKGEVVITRD